jgi:predicted alpha/beta superfamily hydrolase
MDMTSRWLWTALFMIVSMGAQAKEPVVIGETRHLRSKILNEDRTYRVHLPRGYQVSGKRYPVIFLLDGQSHFTHVVGSAGFLMDQEEIPSLIVVGLDSTVRVRDFTPTDWSSAWIGGGGAAKFRAFLAQELLPEIEKSFRTDGFRILAGHSASGQFALYCLESQPSLFQAYIALSPSLDWDDTLPVRGLERALDMKPAIQAFAFVARSDDSGRPLQDFDRLVEIFRTKAPAGLRWKSQAYDRETHGSIALVGMIDALRALYAGWRVPEELVSKGLPAVEAYFAELSRTFGRTVPLTERVVNELAYQALEQKQTKEAVALFRRNVEAHPGSANAFDGLADGLDADGQPEAAVAAQQRAVRLARQTSDGNLAEFEKRLTKRKAALASAKKAAPVAKP